MKKLGMANKTEPAPAARPAAAERTRPSVTPPDPLDNLFSDSDDQSGPAPVEPSRQVPDLSGRDIRETLGKSNLGLLQTGDEVNLERSMRMDGRLDGHIVQGHVDQTARCTRVDEADGSWYYTFEFEPVKDQPGYLVVEKGSVCVNGVSLTVVNARNNSFQVAIIPFTYQVTNFHSFEPGSVVNLEFDILGKYIARILQAQGLV